MRNRKGWWMNRMAEEMMNGRVRVSNRLRVRVRVM